MTLGMNNSIFPILDEEEQEFVCQDCLTDLPRQAAPATPSGAEGAYEMLYFVGCWHLDQGKEWGNWGYVGLFRLEKDAIDACKTWRHFYVPVFVDEDVELVNETLEEVEWPGVIYPIEREE